MFTHNRSAIDLNGKWNFCPDPMQRCRRQKWWSNPPKVDNHFPCWDENGLWETTVPSTWKVEHEELKWYDGHAVYMRDFEANIPEGHEAFLVFDGVLYSSQIYLNGQLAVEHDWGYSPFQVRVTEMLLKYNRIWVLLENIPSMDRTPGEIHDWCNDGGIINPVKLVYVPVTHIKNFKVATSLENEDVVISVDVHLESRDRRAEEEVTITIPELNVEEKIVAKVGHVVTAEIRMPASAIELWSPENPKLYDTVLTTRFETVQDEIGYREIKTVGQDIVLNGEKIRLYGINTHAEFKGTGRTATPEGIDLLISKAKELGVNFLRCAHYPYSEAWGRALDKAGILWWEEVPAYWLPNMHEEAQTERNCGMMSEVIKRDWNRSSLIFWSVSNECCWKNPEDHKVNNYPYWFKIVKIVREMDSSRLVSAAEAGSMISVKPVWTPDAGDEFTRDFEEAGSWRPGHTDDLYELFDVFSANLYVDPGHMLTAYGRFVDMFRAYNKPLMLSEFGSLSLRGATPEEEPYANEERHASVLEEAYEAFKQLPELSGYSSWCLADIRVPLHWHSYNQGKAIFRYGVYDENYEPKEKVKAALQQSIADLKKHFDN